MPISQNNSHREMGFFLSLIIFLSVLTTTSFANSIPWQVVDQSGGIGNSTNYELLDASGQGIIGKGVSTNYTLFTGYIVPLSITSTITVSPTFGTVGTLIMVEGEGFLPTETIIIKFCKEQVVVGSTTATPEGTFSFIFHIDTQALGTTTITATGEDSNRVAKCSFKILPSAPHIPHNLSNVRDTQFTISWITDTPQFCQVNYGPTPALGNTAYDDRHAGTVDDTHHVTIKRLMPDTTYYYDIICGEVVDDNNGAHYTVTTGPSIIPAGSDVAWGRVFKQDGTTPAEGAIVYMELQDTDNQGSKGNSALVSTLVDVNGYWSLDLVNIRTQDYQRLFEYSLSGDKLWIFAQGAKDGTATQVVDTNNDSPAPDMILGQIIAEIDLWIGKAGLTEINPDQNTIEYWVYYGNKGNHRATNITITDILPAPSTGTVRYATDTSGITPKIKGNYVIWEIGTLTPCEKHHRHGFFVTLALENIPAATTLTNTIKIETTDTETKLEDNCAIKETHILPPEVDLEIKKLGPVGINAGEEIIYTITYRNQGTMDAATATIKDTLPVGVSYVSDTSGLPRIISGSGTPTDPYVVSWVVGPITPSDPWDGVAFQLTCKVGSVAVSSILTNVVEIETASTETVYYNNRNTCKTRVGHGVDLNIWKGAPGEVIAGRYLKYRIGYDNYYGDLPAEDVTIEDTLPVGVNYVSDTSNVAPTITGSGTHNSPYVVTWQIGTVSANAKYETFYMTVQVDKDIPISTTLTNKIKITTTSQDKNLNNNEWKWITHVISETGLLPDLEIRKWVVNSEATPNSPVIYHIKYINLGKGEAEDVTITDFMPAKVRYIKQTSGVVPTIEGNKITWQIGKVPGGHFGYFRLEVRTEDNLAASTTLTNVIEITTPTTETSNENNRATCTVHIIEPIADINIYKWGPQESLAGQELVYNINYSNQSSNEVKSVAITDTLDEKVSYVSDTSGLTPIFNGNQVAWQIGTIGPWGSGYFEVKVKVADSVSASSTITNKVKVTTTTRETIFNNNEATCTTHIVTEPEVDVGVHKWGSEARPGFEKTYQITYYNSGTKDAEEVVITDILPPEVEYISSSPSGNYTPDSHAISWNIGTLKAQTSGYITLKVKVPVSVQWGRNLRNYVKIKTTSQEADYTNNECLEVETVVTSIDPNDKLVSPQSYNRNSQTLNYTIRFENVATATASAILITITDRLDTNLDWSTLKPGEIGIGDKVYSLSNFDRGDINYSYDESKGIGKWIFNFHNSENGLPPNKVAPEGEGYVNFTIRTKEELESGTKIRNTASIIFDYNEAMDTKEVVNIIDLDPPNSQIKPLNSVQFSNTFMVSWAGQDTAGNESGEIAHYTLYVSDNGGTYTPWLENTRDISAIFKGQVGHTYTFYSIAKDRAGNIEDIPQSGFDTITTIVGKEIGTPTISNLDSVYYYPNPTKNEITFANLPTQIKVRLRIFNLAGEEVFDEEFLSNAEGKIRWECINNDNQKVASGIYIYLLTDNNGHKKVGKIGVVR